MNECSECGGPEGIHRAGCPEEAAALPHVRSEPLLEWIVSQLTTGTGVPMPVGFDTSAGIVERIRRHSNMAICLNNPTA